MAWSRDKALFHETMAFKRPPTGTLQSFSSNDIRFWCCTVEGESDIISKHIIVYGCTSLPISFKKKCGTIFRCFPFNVFIFSVWLGQSIHYSGYYFKSCYDKAEALKFHH